MRKLLLIALSTIVIAIVVFTVAFWAHPLMTNPEAPPSLIEDSMIFMQSVIGFNTSQYQVIDSHFWPQFDVASSNGLPLYLIAYDLQTSDNVFHLSLFYTEANGTYLLEPYFSFYTDELFYPTYPDDTVLNWTQSFIERYQTFRNNATYVMDIRKTLDSIDHIEPMNITCANMELQIIIKTFSPEDVYTTLQFTQTEQNTMDSAKSVTFEYHNGRLLNFSDNIIRDN